MFDDEVWRPIAGFEFYEVSNLGRVKSLARFVSNGPGGKVRYVRERILVPGRSNGTAYVTVHLHRGSRSYTFKVHILVLEAFVGLCPPGQEAYHVNDIGDDNRLVNLRWDTRLENARNKVRNGRHHHARKTHCPRKHAYTPENTTVYKGKRHCRACQKIRNANRKTRVA